CRQDPAGSKAGRHPGRATDQIRPRHQSNDRQGTRPYNTARAACARRRGDRRNATEQHMRKLALVMILLVGLSAPAFAQKAEIEAANAKWVEFFNKGDFAGIASLYADDAVALPPGSPMVKGKAAIGAMWKG